MQVLVLCDDQWHPAQTVRSGLAPLADSGYAFTFMDDAHAWPPADLQAYPVILSAKMNQVSSTDHTPWETPEVQAAITDYVLGGGGLLVVHAGTVLKGAPHLAALIGGAFRHHPPQCDVTVTPRPDHPLTAGLDAFTVRDEHYWMDMLMDTTVASGKLCLTSTSEHGEQPAGWTRQVGDGRVCVITPGHNLAVWLQPTMQTLLARALAWCAGQPSAQT
jgi:type 1 glutamine amidotransferase